MRRRGRDDGGEPHLQAVPEQEEDRVVWHSEIELAIDRVQAGQAEVVKLLEDM